MSLKYRGNLQGLQMLFLELDLRGEWSSPTKGAHKFDVKGGGVVTWYQSTGTLQIQADPGYLASLIESRVGPSRTLDDFFA